MKMEELRLYQKPELVNPVMIAGWPGVGNVALGVIDYLRRKLNAVKFAEIIVDRQYILDSVTVDNGVASFSRPPKNAFYYTKNPDLIIFEGEVQLPGEAGLSIIQRVLSIAADLKVKRIYTSAALPVPVSFSDDPEVLSVVNMPMLKPFISAYGVKQMESGNIAGFNALLLAFAARRGIESICFLSTVPQYALALPNPKGSLAVIELLGRILNFQVDPEEMKELIKDIEEKMSLIEDKVKDVFIGDSRQADPAMAEKTVPGSVIDKIEKLFTEARGDKAKALTLKSELDRWNLFERYEDRFLDLFRSS